MYNNCALLFLCGITFMTGVSLYSAVDLIEILVLLLDVYSAQAFMTGNVISSGAL